MLRYIILILCFLTKDVWCVDYDGWLQINLLHNINCNGETFCPRGSISVKSIRMGTSLVEQINFNSDHLRDLKALAEEDNFYTVKAIVTSADHMEVEFLSSVKAAKFLDSGLSDVINVWVIHTGAVVSVSFQVANSSNHITNMNKEIQVTSKFYLRHVDQAPVPDTASYIQKLEREKEAREKGELKDNRSFFAKYWMYFVPVVIFVMISGAANPEGAPASR